MKVTNTEHTAINGNHSKCRMTPFSCALCAFARVLSRRCLWHGIFLAKPQRAQGLYSFAWVLSRRCLWRDIFLAKPQRAQGLSAIPNNYGVQFDVPKMELFLIYSDYLLTEHALTSTHCPPFILSRIGQTFLCQFSPTLTQSIAIVHAKHCNRPRKALQSSTQSFAIVHAKLCICQRKALHSWE